MKSLTRFCLLILALLTISCASYAKEAVQSRKPAAHRTLSMVALEDKVRGAWAGQMISVTYGAPTEFRFLGKMNVLPPFQGIVGLCGRSDCLPEIGKAPGRILTILSAAKPLFSRRVND